MKALTRRTAVLFGAALAAAALAVPATAGQGTKLPPVLTSFWAFPKGANMITLVVNGSPEPITVTVAADTSIGGVCMHCTLNQPFKLQDIKKSCGVCGCSKTNGTCVAWKDLKQSSWEELVGILPPGTALRLAFNAPDNPSSGVKTLWIDRRTFFAPVEGLDGKTPADLASIVKALGGGKAEMVDGGKHLVISLKQDLDTDLQAKLDKALAKIGAKIVHPAQVAATQ